MTVVLLSEVTKVLFGSGFALHLIDIRRHSMLPSASGSCDHTHELSPPSNTARFSMLHRIRPVPESPQLAVLVRRGARTGCTDGYRDRPCR